LKLNAAQESRFKGGVAQNEKATTVSTPMRSLFSYNVLLKCERIALEVV